MAEENKPVDEKSLSEPFKNLSQLPDKDISDKDRETAEKLFSQIVDSVKEGHAVTIAEYNLLSNIHKLYDFNTFLANLTGDKRETFAEELKTVADRKVINNFCQPIKTTNLADRKKEIHKRIATLNDALATSGGEFTDAQIKQLQDAVKEFGTVKVKRKNAKTKEETETTYTIPVQQYFAEFKPAKGKKTSPAFTALYQQVYPNRESETADILAGRLHDVRAELDDNADERNNERDDENISQPDPVQQDDENGPQPELINLDDENGPQPEPINLDDENGPQPELINLDDENGPQPELINLDDEKNDDIPPLTMTRLTDDEVNKYMEEVRSSDDLNSYLGNFPKLKDSGIEAAMAIGVEERDGDTPAYISPSARARAFGSPVNILQAYEYYKNDPKKLEELDAVASAYLYMPENRPVDDEAPDKAFGLLALADKIKDKSKGLYIGFTYDLAASLKAYDDAKFESLSDEELHQNYEANKKALQNLPAGDVAKLVAKYTFTDDKGKPLSGKKLEQTQKEVLELARALTAQDLATAGPTDDNSLLLKHLDKVIGTAILNKGVSEEVNKAAKFLSEAQQARFDGLKQKLQNNDKDAVETASEEMARAELKTPERPSKEDLQKLEAKKKEISEKLAKGDKDTLDKAAVTLAAAAGLVVRSEKENAALLQKGDAVASKEAAVMMALQEMNLPYDTSLPFDDAKQQVKFNNIAKKHAAKLVIAAKSQTTFNKSELSGRLAAGMVHAQTFETRARQHYGNKKLFGSVKSWLSEIDKKLTKHYGKPYTNTKNILKFGAQLGYGLAKTQVLMGAAAMVAGPAGIAGYMGYMTYKQIKAAAKQVRDPNMSKWEKAAAIAGATITTGLSALGVGGALGQALGEHGPAILQNCSNLMSQMPWAARGGMVAVAQTLPNWVKGIMLKNKMKKIEKQLKTETDPQKLNVLIGEQAKLRKEQRNNVIDAGTKAVVTMGTGALMQTETAQNLRAGLFGSIGLGFAANTDEAQHTQANETQHTQTGEAQHTQANETQHTQTGEAQHTQTNETQHTQAPGTNENTSSGVHPPFLNAETQAAAEYEAAMQKPDDMHGAKAPEGGLSDEQKTQNLSGAAEKDSGHIGQSDMESMQKDLDSHDGAKLGYTAEEKTTMMKSLAGGFGKESYEAMHAAMAEPRILAEQMGITADVEASAQAAGINTATDYSKAVLNHLATHPELASNEGFKTYVAEHFDAQDRFHSSNYTVHTEVHHAPQQPQAHQPAQQQPAEQPAAQSPVEQKQGGGFKLTPVDKLPTAEKTETVQHHPEVHHQVYNEPIIPPHGIAVEGHMAYVDGQSYHRSMEFSNKLGYTLNDRAIIGVYQNNQNPDDYVMITAPLDRYGQPIPDGRLTAAHHSYEYLRDAQEQAHTGYERVGYKMQSSYGGYGYGARVCYGTGGISQTDVTYAKVSASAHIGGDIAYTVGSVLEAIGENGKGAYKVGTVAHGAGDVATGVRALNQILGKGRG